MMRFANSSRANDVPRVPGFTEDHLPHTILHPSQFRDIWNGEGHSAERELASAMLEAAASDLRNYRYARRRRRQRMYWQTYQWVASDDREWPFSFVNLCEFLRVSPAAMRERLLSPSFEPRRSDSERQVAEAA
jgi:hypothetical protein